MNLEHFTILDRLRLALAVLSDWRVLVALAFFMLIVIIFRELADPYKKKKKPIQFKLPAPKPKKEKPKEEPEQEEDELEEKD